MNNKSQYDTLCRTASTIRTQIESLNTTNSVDRHELDRMKHAIDGINSAFNNNGLNSIRGTGRSDAKWHGKSWAKWETIIATYQLMIPKLMISVFATQCKIDKLTRQVSVIDEQLGAIRYENHYGKKMFV
jgi:hypothetical protein